MRLKCGESISRLTTKVAVSVIAGVPEVERTTVSLDCHQGGYFTTLALSSEEKQQVCSVICPPEVNIPSSSIRLFSSLASFFADSFLAFFVSRGFFDSFLFLSSEVSEFN